MSENLPGLEPESDRDAVLTISKMAKAFNVTPRTLRFYEDKGLLTPARDGQTRLYSHRDRARLRLILQGKRVGLPLDDIREILELYRLEDGERVQLFKTRERLVQQIDTLENQKKDLDRALSELHRGVDWLDTQIDKLKELGVPYKKASQRDKDKMSAFAEAASVGLHYT